MLLSAPAAAGGGGGGMDKDDGGGMGLPGLRGSMGIVIGCAVAIGSWCN